MSYFTQQIKKYKSEPLHWAIYILFTRLLAKVRSALYANLLNAPGLSIGKGNIIKGIKYISMGRNIFINDGAWIEAISSYRGQKFEPEIIIGDNVSFSRNVHIASIGKIHIGNGVLFGSNIYISDHNHGIYNGDKQSSPNETPSQRELDLCGPVIIEDNVWVGDNVVVLGPARIGAGAILAANSVVKGDIAPVTVVAGVPANPIKHFDSANKVWRRI